MLTQEIFNKLNISKGVRARTTALVGMKEIPGSPSSRVVLRFGWVHLLFCVFTLNNRTISFFLRC